MVRRVEVGDDASETASVTPLVWWWLAAGIAAVAMLVWASPAAPAFGSTFLILVALTAAAESAAVVLQAGRSGLSLTLLEVLAVVAMLLLHPVSAVLAVVAGVAISHTSRRLGPQKIIFNIGQHAVAASGAAAAMMVAPAGEVISSPRAAAAVIGVLLYSTINSVALASVFARLGLASFREQLTERPGFLVATSVGNASVGVIAVALWTAYPTVSWIIAGPALALYLSYGSSFRIEALLSDVSSERDHLDRVVSGVQEGIVLLDDRGVVRLWNAAMVRITGISEGEALGKSASSVMSGTDQEGSVVDPVHALMTRQDTAAYTVALTDTDGQSVETRVAHTLVKDERGRCIGDVVLVQDLSREREAHSLKEDFVARVSHELRTPLSPLRGYAQVMLTAGDKLSDERRTAMLHTIVERVGHLERLIEDLLLVSRVSSGSPSPTDEVSLEATDLDEVVLRMTDWIGRDHGDREIRLSDDGLDHVAWADPLRVGQIVTNLVSNACKYATPGTPVDVTVTRDADELRIDVRDHGPGIPDDKLEAIFERFQRLEDPQRMRTGGLGLGLYIARHLASAMGGRLEVTSERGRGSTFSATLPAATADQRRLVPQPANGGRPSGSRVHRRGDLAVVASAGT